MKNDIHSLEDIKLLVNTFYERVRQDEVLGKIFDNIIQDRWPQHLETMYKFWQSILLNENTYAGQPFLKHLPLPIADEHFVRWLYLFHHTVNELFEGDVANDANKRAAQIAAMFSSKLKVVRGDNA